jgi:hypothetical protein
VSGHERPAAAQAAATLARLGIDPETLLAGEVAEERLAALIEGPEAAALATALGEFPTPRVASLLVGLERRARDRPARRAIRRALYRLRQQGVATPPPEPVASPPRAEPVAEGFVSAFDGRGDRLIWIVRPLATGGVLLIAAEVNEPAGLLGLQAAEIGRKRLREARRELEAAGLRLLAADWRTLDALLVEAHARAASSDRERDYLRLRPRLTVEPPRPPAEPVSAQVAPPGADEVAGLTADSAGLLDEPELARWLLDPEAAAPFLEELAAARESPLLVSRAAQEERIRAILKRAAETLIPPATLARRLEGMAYVFAETGRPTRAREALAVAHGLRERPAGDVPFVTALTERGLGNLFAADTARREDDRRGALVVTPGQLLRDRSPSRPGRIRG